MQRFLRIALNGLVNALESYLNGRPPPAKPSPRH